MPDVLVVGTGLIGTSIGMALTQGDYDVLLHDRHEAVRDAAVGRGAGAPWNGVERADVIVAAVPPTHVATVLKYAQDLDLGQTYTHVSSVQSQVQDEVETLGCDLATFVGGHPLAGSESSGPDAATADLFVGRPWAICPSVMSTPASIHAVRELARACGAVPMELAATEHDAAVALLSHLPQVVASALAGLLSGSHPISAALSGPGLADTTRLAASDAVLWTDILCANAGHVSPAVAGIADLLRQLALDLASVAEGQSDGRTAVAAFLERGNRGRALVPIKRGVRDAGFARVAVEVDDTPGRLAALLTAAGEAGVNVEDVHVDHVPGRARGVIELLVDAAAQRNLAAALRAGGWVVRT